MRAETTILFTSFSHQQQSGRVVAIQKGPPFPIVTREMALTPEKCGSGTLLIGFTDENLFAPVKFILCKQVQ
jgi:hypothetical protein